MMLSDNFTLAEMIASNTALRRGLANVPAADEIDNLRRLCAQVLEPLRAAIGKPITITSGYRSPALNVAIGGAASSDHCFGRAADIKVAGMPARELCETVVIMGLPFKQVIHEFGAWCHVSIPPASELPKREALTAVKLAGRTHYERGIV